MVGWHNCIEDDDATYRQGTVYGCVVDSVKILNHTALDIGNYKSMYYVYRVHTERNIRKLLN